MKSARLCMQSKKKIIFCLEENLKKNLVLLIEL